MEKRGMVERRHGTEDRRTVLVFPTQAGVQVFRDMAAHRRDMLSAVLAELTEEETAALLIGMRAIHAARRRVFDAVSEPQTGAGSPQGGAAQPEGGAAPPQPSSP
jgi:DNA-binding MarR family transcriptional regulator